MHQRVHTSQHRDSKQLALISLATCGIHKKVTEFFYDFSDKNVT